MNNVNKYTKAKQFEASGLTQKDAAKKAGMSYSSFKYYDIKAKKPGPSKKALSQPISFQASLASQPSKVFAIYGTPAQVAETLKGMQ